MNQEERKKVLAELAALGREHPCVKGLLRVLAADQFEALTELTAELVPAERRAWWAGYAHRGMELGELLETVLREREGRR